jgi:hypothetical protein
MTTLGHLVNLRDIYAMSEEQFELGKPEIEGFQKCMAQHKEQREVVRTTLQNMDARVHAMNLSKMKMNAFSVGALQGRGLLAGGASSSNSSSNVLSGYGVAMVAGLGAAVALSQGWREGVVAVGKAVLKDMKVMDGIQSYPSENKEACSCAMEAFQRIVCGFGKEHPDAVVNLLVAEAKSLVMAGVQEMGTIALADVDFALQVVNWISGVEVV